MKTHWRPELNSKIDTAVGGYNDPATRLAGGWEEAA